MIFIIGVDHDWYQHLSDWNVEYVNDLKVEVRYLITEEGVQLIAEESSVAGLKKRGIEKTVAQEIADELEIPHKHIDPDLEEREVLGIRTRKDVAKSLGIGPPDEATEEDIAKINEDLKPDYRLREEEWLRRIESNMTANIAVVCGFQHVESFQELLESRGYDSVVHVILD
ncbi:MAG: hypothetical protein JKX80_02040 [Candidatus Pacebacteria bacterium]|nr:hypothetical protein [Candidatus Paceibacterota bacterium]